MNKHSWRFWEMDLTSFHQSCKNTAAITELLDHVFWFLCRSAHQLQSDQMKKCFSYEAAFSPFQRKQVSPPLPPPSGNSTGTSSLDDLSMLDYHAIIYQAALCCPEPPTRTSQWCLCSGVPGRMHDLMGRWEFTFIPACWGSPSVPVPFLPPAPFQDKCHRKSNLLCPIQHWWSSLCQNLLFWWSTACDVLVINPSDYQKR